MAKKKLELAQAREKGREDQEYIDKINKKNDDLNFELLKRQEASAEKNRKLSQLKAELLEARQKYCTDTPGKTSGLSLLGKRAGN